MKILSKNLKWFNQNRQQTDSNLKLLLFAALLTVSFGCTPQDRGVVGTQAPDFTVSDMASNEYTLSELKGKVVVLNFWFVGCPPCIREMPELNDLVKEFDGEGVVFLALARDGKTKISKFLEKKDFDYTIIPRSKWMTKRFNTHGFPTNLIIDQNGEIVYHMAGYEADGVKKMSAAIRDAL